jgi:hypothetical protein
MTNTSNPTIELRIKDQDSGETWVRWWTHVPRAGDTLVLLGDDAPDGELLVEGVTWVDGPDDVHAAIDAS